MTHFDIHNIILMTRLDIHSITYYSKTCVKRPLSKRPQIVFSKTLSLIASKKYCRMLQGEHSGILSTFIKLLFRSLICLFLSGCLRRLYCIVYFKQGCASLLFGPFDLQPSHSNAEVLFPERT